MGEEFDRFTCISTIAIYCITFLDKKTDGKLGRVLQIPVHYAFCRGNVAATNMIELLYETDKYSASSQKALD